MMENKNIRIGIETIALEEDSPPIRIGIDADNGEEDSPPVKRIVRASRKLARVHPEIEFVLSGNEDDIYREFERGWFTGSFPENVRVISCSEKYSREKPLEVRENTSLYALANEIKTRSIDAIVTIGDATQMGAVFSRVLGERRICKPSFVVKVPSEIGFYLLGDVGASGERVMYPNNPAGEQICTLARDVYNQGLMSIVYSMEMGNTRPRVGVLCNGTEDFKGSDLMHEVVRLFYERVSQTKLGEVIDFKGRVEVRDTNNMDVVVTSGVLGNIDLKQAEGTSRLVKYFAKDEIKRSPWLWPFLPGFYLLGRRISKRMDPDENSGAILLGFDSVFAVKDHGGANHRAIYRSGERAIESVRLGLGKSIRSFVEDYGFVRGRKVR